MKSVAILIGDIPEERGFWNDEQRFKYQWVSGLTSLLPNRKIILISHKPLKPLFSKNAAVEYQELGTRPTRSWNLNRHLNHKLSAVLQKVKPTLFISLEGFIPKNYSGKSMVLLPDALLPGSEKKKSSLWTKFQNKHLSQTLRLAEKAFVFSPLVKDYISNTFSFPKDKIILTPPLIEAFFRPLEWEEREEVKEKHAKDREYLLYLGGLSQKEPIIRLLKAFTLLKKKMNSSMILIIAHHQGKVFKKFDALFRTYHFRKDVVLVREMNNELKAQLIGGAYAVILPETEPHFYNPVAETIQCHTPALVPRGSLREEMGKETTLKFKKEDYHDLGTQLCEIYRNEELRSKLIQQAKIKTTQTSPATTLTLFSDIIINHY